MPDEIEKLKADNEFLRKVNRLLHEALDAIQAIASHRMYSMEEIAEGLRIADVFLNASREPSADLDKD